MRHFQRHPSYWNSILFEDNQNCLFEYQSTANSIKTYLRKGNHYGCV